MTNTLSHLDYITIVIYLLLMAGVGVFFGFFIKDVSSYFKGAGSIPWPIAGISNFMGLFSTFIFVAYAGVAYEYGLVAITVQWCTVPACLFAMFFMAKRWQRAGIITPTEYLEKRFNGSVRQLFSWSGLFVRFLDNIVRMYAIGLFLSAAVPLKLPTIIIISGLIITFFTILGGIWAVAVMDTIQFVVLILSTFILVPLAIKAANGFSSLATSNPEHLNWLNGPKGAPLWLIVYYIMITLKYNANWTFIQRLYSVRDERAAQKVSLLCAGLFFIFPILFLIPPTLARTILPDLADKEMAYVSLSLKLLPPGIMGIMISSMFAATMSSLNSEINVMASVLTVDIYQKIKKAQATQTELFWAGRFFTLLVGIILTTGALFVGGFGGAFEANKLFTSIFAIPMAVPLLLGIIFKRANPFGAILTICIGALMGLLFNYFSLFEWHIVTLLEIIVCVVIFMASGWVKSRKRACNQSVEQLFQKLSEPIPESSKQSVSDEFKRSLSYLFAGSLGITGILFASLSIPTLMALSGKLAMSAGLICIVGAIGFCKLGNRFKKKQESIC